MAKTNSKRPLVPESKPSQRTKTGYEIPVPKRKDVFDLFNRAAKKRAPVEGPPSEPEPETHRTSPDP